MISGLMCFLQESNKYL